MLKRLKNQNRPIKEMLGDTKNQQFGKFFAPESPEKPKVLEDHGLQMMPMIIEFFPW